MMQANTCETCGKRMGFMRGLRGFGLRERLHPRRCAARVQREAVKERSVKNDAEVVDSETSTQPFQLKPSVGTWMLRPCHPLQGESERVPLQENSSVDREETSDPTDAIVETNTGASQEVATAETATPPAETQEGVVTPSKSQEESAVEPAEVLIVAEDNADTVLNVSELAKPVDETEATEVPEPIKPGSYTEKYSNSNKGRKGKGKGKGKGTGKDRRQR
jgi:hypothetical protein